MNKPYIQSQRKLKGLSLTLYNIFCKTLQIKCRVHTVTVNERLLPIPFRKKTVNERAVAGYMFSPFGDELVFLFMFLDKV